MQALRQCQLPSPFHPLALQCEFYYYSYEFRNVIHKLLGSTVTRVFANQSKQVSGDALRKTRTDFPSVPRSCYHCTWCFNQIKEVRFKMSSYSHTEHNRLEFRTREHIIDRFRTGQDLFDRPGETYVYVDNNLDYPQLVKAQPDRFHYMMKRANSSNAGFIDLWMESIFFFYFCQFHYLCIVNENLTRTETSVMLVLSLPLLFLLTVSRKREKKERTRETVSLPNISSIGEQKEKRRLLAGLFWAESYFVFMASITTAVNHCRIEEVRIWLYL